MQSTPPPRPRLAFALDFPSLAEAREVARELAPVVGMLKVGLELFVEAGADAVRLGADNGLPVFLDLKLHDIPETVGRAVERVGRLGARIVTVHAAGGPAMLARAVEAARASTDAGRPLDVCAVTLLTSLDDADIEAIGLAGSTEGAAVRLARLAWDAGVRWFVCSPEEVSAVREALGPGAILVTPGVRPARSEAHPASAGADQKRVATPEEAIARGATWLVVGRPIRDARDRVAAARAIGAAILSSSKDGSTQ